MKEVKHQIFISKGILQNAECRMSHLTLPPALPLFGKRIPNGVNFLRESVKIHWYLRGEGGIQTKIPEGYFF